MRRNMAGRSCSTCYGEQTEAGITDMSKRITIFLPNLTGGGVELVALNLTGGFPVNGHLVDLVVAEARGELLPIVPSWVKVIDLKAPRLRHALLPLVRYLRRRWPDVIQVSMWPLTVIGTAAAMIARTGTRVVVSEHIALSQQYGGSSLSLRASDLLGWEPKVALDDGLKGRSTISGRW